MNVIEEYLLASSNAFAASAGPLLADRWHRRSFHCTARRTVTFGLSPESMVKPYEPALSGEPSPEARKAPIDTMRWSRSWTLRTAGRLTPGLSPMSVRSTRLAL